MASRLSSRATAASSLPRHRDSQNAVVSSRVMPGHIANLFGHVVGRKRLLDFRFPVNGPHRRAQQTQHIEGEQRHGVREQRRPRIAQSADLAFQTLLDDREGRFHRPSLAIARGDLPGRGRSGKVREDRELAIAVTRRLVEQDANPAQGSGCRRRRECQSAARRRSPFRSGRSCVRFPSKSTGRFEHVRE